MSAVEKMQALCGVARPQTDTPGTLDAAKTPLYRCAAQMKILMDTPEQVGRGAFVFV